MKKTQDDLTFFKSLSQTETGTRLADYLKKVIDFAHDSRSWKDGDTKESASHAARLIREELLEVIRPGSKNSKTDYQFD